MGLDCWFKDPCGKPKTTGKGYELCEANCSPEGSDAFRGKVYARFIADVFGQHLWYGLDMFEVQMLSERLDEVTYKASWLDEYGISEGVYEDLRRMFRDHSRMCSSLVSWS